jgi:ketosteroid isomerase-like protein
VWLEQTMEGGNFEQALSAVADDVEWHEIGRSEPSRGKQAMLQRFAELAGEVQITTDMHDVLANDEHTVQLMNVTARRGDETFHYRTAEIYHIKDGKITARWAFSDDTARIMEFFGS